jgi:hypothetical protein
LFFFVMHAREEQATHEAAMSAHLGQQAMASALATRATPEPGESDNYWPRSIRCISSKRDRDNAKLTRVDIQQHYATGTYSSKERKRPTSREHTREGGKLMGRRRSRIQRT